MLSKLNKLLLSNIIPNNKTNKTIFPSTLHLLEKQLSKMAANTSKVQSLYDLCKQTLTPTATPPASQAVHKLCSLLDTIGPADVGLKGENNDDDRGFGLFGYSPISTVARWAQPLTYIDIHECENFTICIFCFPTSAVIPLHDHPGMTVFSKLLYGSLHVKAYDWVEPANIKGSKRPGQSPVRLAKLAVDKILNAPCTTSVLYPKSGGNLHCFTAVAPCAMLDVLTPSYKEEAGRKCTYYRDYPYSSLPGSVNERAAEKENYSWLEEIQTPDDLYMRPGRYAGPPIQL